MSDLGGALTIDRGWSSQTSPEGHSKNLEKIERLVQTVWKHSSKEWKSLTPRELREKVPKLVTSRDGVAALLVGSRTDSLALLGSLEAARSHHSLSWVRGAEVARTHQFS